MERAVFAAAALAGMAHVARAGPAYLWIPCLLSALGIGWQVARLRRERLVNAPSVRL